MNIQIMCLWPSAAAMVDDPDAETTKIVQAGVEGLAVALQQVAPVSLSMDVIHFLEESVQKSVDAVLPLPGKLVAECRFDTPQLLSIHVKTSHSVILPSRGVLH